jgi:type I restriction enzyme S subunit
MTNSPISLSQGWVKTNIDDVVEVILGQSPPSSTYNDHGEGLPFFQGKLEFGELHPTVQKWCSHPNKIATAGDVLLSIRAPVGATNIATEKCCIGRGLAALHPVAGVSSLFILYVIRAFESKIAEQSTGSTFDAITSDRLRKVELSLPPLSEQHRIVTKIEELFTQLDAGVASLKKVQAQLKRYRQAVLKAAFEGRLTQEWREEHKGEIEPANMLLDMYKANLKNRTKGKAKSLQPLDIDVLPRLPENWIWTRIGDFIEIVRGASPRPAGSALYFGGTIPWITVGELTKDEDVYLKAVSSYVTEEGKKNSRYIKSDTLLLTNSGATLGVPKITLIDGCINDGSVALLGLDEIPKHYLYFFLKSQTKRLRQINQGAAQPNLNTDIVRNIIFPLPPLEEQQVIINEIERHFSQIDHLENTIETCLRQADTLRQSILKRAFEGKLVPQDPNDEPASVLLERIKAEKARHQTEAKKVRNTQRKPKTKKVADAN